MFKLRKFASAFIPAILLFNIVTPAFSTAEDCCSRMDRLISGYGMDCAVLVRTADGTTLYSHQPDKLFQGASLIKLPYAIWVCRQLDAGVHSLDDTMTYTADRYHGGSGIIIENGFGRKYTVAELLDYSLRYSDNAAYDMLLELFGTEGFNDMVKKWGYSVSIDLGGITFPVLSANFMLTAMTEMESHKSDSEPWRIAWTALLESTVGYTRQSVWDRDVALKYGFMDSVYHEVSWVCGDEPYFLAIFTSISGMDYDEDIIRNIAECADNAVMEKARNDLYRAHGDVNGDHRIDAADASLVLTEYSILSTGGTGAFDAEQKSSADVNGDGFVNAADASKILYFYSILSTGGDPF